MNSCDKCFFQYDSLIVKGMPLFLHFFIFENLMQIYDDLSIISTPPFQFQHISINTPLPLHVPFVFDNPLDLISNAPLSSVKSGSGAWGS